MVPAVRTHDALRRLHRAGAALMSTSQVTGPGGRGDEHQVVRPEWTCAADGQQWPCTTARKLLVDAFPDRAALAGHLAALQALAADELGIAGPATLYRRVLGLALGDDEACRVRGRSTHTAVPAIPRRLMPCEGLPMVIPPLRTPERRRPDAQPDSET